MANAKTLNILRIDASARHTGSITRDLNDTVVAHLNNTSDVTVKERDLADGPLPQIDEAWIGANFTPADNRTDAQRETLGLSDTLVSELEAADIVLIGLPIYNFGVPAALKAWIDLVARAGRTFRYTANGPEGLLEGKKAIVTVASGGTTAGSDIDFATGYIRHVLAFIGIEDVDVIAADGLGAGAEEKLKAANDDVARLTIAA